MEVLTDRQQQFNLPQDEDEEEAEQIDLVIKLKLKRLNNDEFELFYPNYKLNPIYLKNVFIRVKSLNTNENLCENLLGIYPDLAYDHESNQFKLIIQGLTPNRFSYEQNNQLKLGDLIVSINNVDINASNLDTLLALLNQNQLIKITTVNALNYYELLNDKKDRVCASTANSNRIIAVSKSTQVVLGDRVKCSDPSGSLNQDEVSYLVMVLAFGQKTDSDQMV